MTVAPSLNSNNKADITAAVYGACQSTLFRRFSGKYRN
jgi:hypothetical protein